MSAIGIYSYNIGNQYNVYCTDLTVSQLRRYKKETLPANAIIISSPLDKTKTKDICTPAIVMTDYASNVLPLTYTINKNHFTVNESTNQIELNSYYLDLADRIARIENKLNII